MLALMREAHFTRVFLGIETPVAESLKETTKFQNLRKDLLESVKLIQAYGMEVMAGFIVGFDNDPPDVFDRQIAFIREAAIPLSMVGSAHRPAEYAIVASAQSGGTAAQGQPGSNTLADLTSSRAWIRKNCWMATGASCRRFTIHRNTSNAPRLSWGS